MSISDTNNTKALGRLGKWALAIALVHLACFAFLLSTQRAEPVVVSKDAVEYLSLSAYPLTHGIYSLDGVTSSAKREPGYSGFISVFIASGLVKPHEWKAANLAPVILVQILLYGWVCLLVAREAARRFGFGTAIVTLLLMQLTPLAQYQYMIRNECLTMVLLGLLWVTMSRAYGGNMSWTMVLLSALYLALLGLTKSLNVLFMPVLGLLLWWKLPLRWPKVAALVLLALLPSMLWTARNQAVFGLPIMGSMDGVSSLYRGNILPYQQIPSPQNPAMPQVAQDALAKCANDGERYLWYKAAALDWLQDNKLQYVKQCIHRTAAMFIDLYRADDIPAWQYPFRLLLGNDQLFLTLLLLVCVVPLWRQQDFWSLSAVIFFLFSVAMYGAVYGEERYLHPAFYLLAPVHAWCLVKVVIPWLRSIFGKKEDRLKGASGNLGIESGESFFSLARRDEGVERTP